MRQKFPESTPKQYKEQAVCVSSGAQQWVGAAPSSH